MIRNRSIRWISLEKCRRLSLLLIWLGVGFGVTVPAMGKVEPYDLDDPTEPWQTTKFGVSTEIMPPYTPLVRKGYQVQCLGRTYDLSLMFPMSVQSQGQQLLAQPIALEIKTAGQWTSVTSKPTTFTKDRPDRIDFKATSVAGDVMIMAQSWIEYDGYIRTDLMLSSSQPVKIEGLRLVFPFELEASILYHTEKRWAGHIYKNSPSEPGMTVNYEWQPLAWVGNHDVGFTVVTETWNGWTSSDEGAISFQRNEKDLTLSLNIITEQTELKDEKVYQFAFMATPAKTMIKDRWQIQIGSMPGKNVTTSMHGEHLHKYFSFPQAIDFAKIEDMIAKLHQKGIRHCYYITTSSVGPESQVFKRHEAQWTAAQVVLEGPEWKVTGPPVAVGICCPTTGYADWTAWSVENIMKTYPDNYGIYIDNPGPYWCENQRHGCGKGGKKTYPYFSLHDLHKRIYTIVKTYKPDGLVWEHTSQTFNPLQLAWLDIYSEGEQWRNNKSYPNEKILRLFDRAYMEINATGHQVGAVPVFLAVLSARSKEEWTEWQMARLLPFGQIPWINHGWIDGTPATAVVEARNRFGLGTEPATFYRPHELPEWFRVSGKNVVACLWERHKDKALLSILANWNDRAIRAEINSGAIDKHLGNCAMTDATTGTGFPGPFIVTIPADSFRVVRIDPKP